MARMAGRLAHSVAMQISARDHPAGIMLSPDKSERTVGGWFGSKGSERLTCWVRAISKGDDIFQTNDGNYASTYPPTLVISKFKLLAKLTGSPR